MNKPELKQRLTQSRAELFQILDTLSDEELQTFGVVGEWSIKDMLVHIMLWEAELVKLLWQARRGQQPSTAHFPLRQDYDEINHQWYLEHKARPLARVFPDFAAVRQQTIRRLDRFSNADLNDPKRYPWLAGKPLWEWIAEASFAHEEKHIADIQAWLDSK